MSSSNSFNICPRCGNSNSLNAKYCSRCGATLKIPTEAVVCHKCHTRNSSLANFCRNCGATLKVGAQTKICPRCGREIGAEENICACGYSFVTLQQTEPRRADVSSTNKEKKKDKKHEKERRSQPANNEVTTAASPEKNKTEKKPKQKKRGRGFAFFALIFLAVFVYVIIAPSAARPSILTNFDKGFYHYNKDAAPEKPEDDEGGENTAIVQDAAQLFAEGGESGEEETTEPTETDPTETDPADPTTPTEPTDPDPSETDPTDPDPVDPNPTNPDPVDPNPTNPDPVDPDPSNPDPSNPDSENPPATGDNEDDGTSESNTENTEGEQEYVYGWSLIDLVIKFFKDPAQIEAMNNCPEGKVAYVMEQLGQGTFVVIVMFALFLLTAALHLIVCLARLISPKRSRHANLLYLILAIVTTLLTAMMLCSHFLAGKEGFMGDIYNFFIPKHDGINCVYGYALIFIPVYYWFFWLYSHIAKKAAPKKDKKS